MSERVEELLRDVPLREPSAELDERVLAARPRPLVRVLAAAGAAAAAAIVVVFGAELLRTSRPAKPPAEVPRVEVAEAPSAPVRMERTVWDLSHEGIFMLDERTPMRKFRRRILECVRWIDPEQGLIVDMTVPREEVILISAETN